MDYSSTQSINLCNGGTITVGNNIYNSTGVYTDIFSTSSGCDSIIITDLTIGNTSISSNNINICQGDYYSVGNNIYTQSGQYIDTLFNGTCDSIIQTNLIVNQISNSETIIYVLVICFINNTILIFKIIHDTLVSIFGCDKVSLHIK